MDEKKKNEDPVQNDGNALPEAGDGVDSRDDNNDPEQEIGEGAEGSGKDESGEGAEGGEEEETGEEPKILTAVCNILYLSRQYKVGEELPANNPDMVSAWIDAGTAVWMCAGKESPKAKPMTAEPGLPGQAAQPESQDGGDLVGKVPVKKSRKKR